MKIEIKLEDTRLCDDCPCMNNDYEQGSWCNLKYWDDCDDTFGWKHKTSARLQKERPQPQIGWDLVTIRPQICITKNGE